ncbi:MAG TPA: winged helix-turn-helix domain-containing protein [Candidatus Baltobacteraceae bacterium]|nr:winged helix-turn-helix domain-containing protein [Candidatus Baltobacteraceae bacterium]
MMHAFGDFKVDVVRRTVTKNGVPVHLTLKCMELLVAFVRNPGKTLSKEDLLEQAWPDPTASDATLAQHVFLLRRALRTKSYEWIRTVPNVGYCFTADVVTIDEGDDERTRALRAYIEGARAFRDIGTERALRSAIDLCSHAIALEDALAPAYALRASCWRLLAESMHVEPLPCLQAAQADVQAALARNSQNADVRIEAASCAALLDRDPSQVHRHLEAASRLEPLHPALPHARVWLALMCGRIEEALSMGRVYGGALYGAALYMTRDFARAAEIFDLSADRNPAVRVMRGSCRMLMNDVAGALDDFHGVYYTDDATLGGAVSVRHYALGLYVFALARSGQVRAARAHVRRLERLARQRYVSPMARAAAHLGLQEIDAAVECVREALCRLDPWSAFVTVDPVFEELRSREEFAALMSAA